MQWDYGIGLDIGVTSVGWAVVALDENAKPYGLLHLGSRIFKRAEQPKTGESLAAPRRQARSMRRRLRRRAQRKQDFYMLLAQFEMPGYEQMQQIFQSGGLEDIYALRTRALDEPVTKQEFVRILLHLLQRRGFQSNRRAENNSTDGALLCAVKENKKRMQQEGYRTPGEMFYKADIFAGHKRNKGDEYIATVSRDEIRQEVEQIFSAQRHLGQQWASTMLEERYMSILLRQRSFDQGPGGNSPYRGGWENRIGTCTLLKEEKRACKNTYAFERFAVLQKINHLRIRQNGILRALTQPERTAVLELAQSIENVPYSRIRKELGWGEEISFSDVRYAVGQPLETAEKKYKLPPMKGYHALRKILGTPANANLWNEIVTVLSIHKDEQVRREWLQKKDLTNAQIEMLVGLDFSGTGHISIKACQMIEPYLLQGMTYDQACSAAGLEFQGHSGIEKKSKLPTTAPELDNITSPVVRRAVAQTIKVVNAIIRQMGNGPVFVNIELARELSKTYDERVKAEKAMLNNAAENEQLMQEMRESFGLLSPSGQDLVKYRLWKEQDGICAYSQRSIEIERLFEPGYAEVDHIIPYSISFDDSRSNKVLVFAQENRQKGNRLPMEYLQGERREKFIVWTKSQVKNDRKQKNLLRVQISDEERNEFRQRNLQDTQHMAKFLMNYIRDHLLFAPHSAAGKQHVVALSGGITSHLRKRWGLTKVRDDGDLHHALDAAVIACATQRMVQQVSAYYGKVEGQYVQEENGAYSVHTRTKERFPAPWPHFRDELMLRLSEDPRNGLLAINPKFYSMFSIDTINPVFVSRMVQHKVTGAAHKETVKSGKILENSLVVVKRPLTDLKLDKDNQIQGYYNPTSDTLLYEALRAQLIQFDGNAKKAFAQPFYKPKADGTPGPLVRKVKLVEKASLTVPVHKGRGVADNDTMVRVDVFYVPSEGYYMVPIYVADTCKADLPNRAVVAHKAYSEWKPMQEKHFVFSLYADDLIAVQHKKEMQFSLALPNSTRPQKLCAKQMLAYYTGMNISTGAISLFTHDGAYMLQGLGVKTLQSIKKYEVDVLGNLREVTEETRRTFR